MKNEKEKKKKEKWKTKKTKRKEKKWKTKKKKEKWKTEKKKRKNEKRKRKKEKIKKSKLKWSPVRFLWLPSHWLLIDRRFSIVCPYSLMAIEPPSSAPPPPWKQVIPKSSTPFTPRVYLREHFVMWTWVFLSENTEFNEISFIAKKHRIIFVRKSVTDRSNRQCLRKIIKFDESAKSFECSHIRSLIIEAIHDARFVHKLPILPYRPWKIAKHSSIQQDCAVSKRKNLPALNLLTNWFEQTQVSRPPHHSFVCIVWLEWLTDLFLLFTFLFFLFSWQLYYN